MQIETSKRQNQPSSSRVEFPISRVQSFNSRGGISNSQIGPFISRGEPSNSPKESSISQRESSNSRDASLVLTFSSPISAENRHFSSNSGFLLKSEKRPVGADAG